MKFTRARFTRKISPSSLQGGKKGREEMYIRCLKILVCSCHLPRSFTQICHFTNKVCGYAISEKNMFHLLNILTGDIVTCYVHIFHKCIRAAHSLIITMRQMFMQIKIFMWTPEETELEQRFVSLVSLQRVNVIF